MIAKDPTTGVSVIDNAKTAVNQLADGNLKNAAQSAGVKVSISYGQQKSKTESNTQSTNAQESQVLGESVSITARDNDINIIGSDVSGRLNTDLTAANNVNIKSFEETYTNRSNNQSSGFSVGATFEVGNGMAFGINASANAGKGKANGDSTTHRNSHVGSTTGKTTITARKTLNIQGGQIAGKGIAIDATDLNIESLQDTSRYHSKQQNLSGSVTVGAGGSGNIGYNQSKINADYASVNEQSGIFAGDDGYQIHIKNHTDLTGGLITSTANAEQNGKNSFATGTITFADLANKAEYSGNGFGIGVSGTIAGTPNNNLINVANKYSLSSDGIGYGHDSDKQHSITKSGINTANITIRDTAKQQALTGKSVEETIKAVKTDITLENHQNLSGRLDNNFDAKKVQNEIDLQVEVTQEFSRNLQDYNRRQNQRKDKLKAQLENNEISQKEYEEQVKTIDRQNLGLNMVAGGLLAPSDSVLGIATSTLAPAASYQVGQYFKDLADQNPNGELTTSQKTAHIATHAALGAATAAANGTNALTGAISAGGAEALAPIVAKVLYGKDNSQNLTADEKETVVAVTTAIGTLSGSIVGDSSANAYIGNTVAGNAVANNWLTAEQNIRKKEIEQLLRQKLQLADSILGGDIDRAKINALMKELRALEKESADNDRQLEAAINSCIDYLSCDTLKKIHWDLRRELSEKGWAKFEQDRKN
ncbi:MAG: hemagglutinin repeat-containing protein, partial [Neisseriaceae bacterium]|nr:hemagglutinin repeat-containing protein [Neisseriaceae bacterium]